MANLGREVAKRIKSLRQALGITQEQLALRIGVDTKFVADVENQRRLNPTLGTLARFSGALGVAPHELLTGGSRAPTAEEAVLEALIRKADAPTRRAILCLAKAAVQLREAKK